ncbi:glycine--tRNA ligase subunit beta [Bacillus altitudinis]|uniref:glycine--tRNA ligase subunit beta n=1 Tax=Bacillus altitudinis TaxID=293387 RepID=UPI000C24D777|nr:glycine--tRNA ligase subunit beta [Bacillus altitudinis]PJI12656.1 glycine--tRNA ligase subunit beta [Bacillus altitudinis]PKQ85254.1 glycine--tRNA ligase subunit beta [Bacillus altitudinis]
MNKQDVLLEIGLEEMPARFMPESTKQLGDKVKAWFVAQNISFEDVALFNSPRRLAVLVKGVAEKQEDIKEEAKGPAKKIAQDAEGNWTKAAEGFARGQGASTDDLYFKDIKGVDYVHVQKFQEGKQVKDLLPALGDIAASLSFPKNMRWGSEDLRYIRPIKWIVCLFGQEIIPVEIAGVKSGRETRGHRFLGTTASIDTPASYEQTLREQFVIVDSDKRKKLITEQLHALSSEKGWVIPVDPELLEEVNDLVEYPTVLFGSFEEEFLALPEEVLVTTMKEHQRYFPVKNEQGELLPHFITVRNGNSEALENVARGNEKVLRARLSDAAFFYKEDEKLVIEDNIQKLDKVVFHEKLGTIGDKLKRVTDIAVRLASHVGADEETSKRAARAASISKFDLVTQMVYEFPELQGIMGEKYARALGEHEEVAKSINEHYMPRFAGDDAPSTLIGAIVAVADKLDSICSFFSIDVIPTGSQDPYGLRRQASGIVQILLDRQWNLSFKELLALAQVDEKHEAALIEFLTHRLKYVLQAEHIRHDVVEAVLDVENIEPYAVVKKAAVLEESVKQESFKETAEALGRVISISKKGEDAQIQPELFENEYEQKLFEAYQQAEKAVNEYMAKGQYQSALEALDTLKAPIVHYFDHTMVHADDEKLKQNRLAQMVKLAKVIQSFANMNNLIVK